MKTTKFGVGDIVKLKEGVRHVCPEGRTNNEYAIVQVLLDHCGLKTVDDLVGCRYWNEDDLELAEPPQIDMELWEKDELEARFKHHDELKKFACGRPIMHSIDDFEHPLNNTHVIRDRKTYLYYSERYGMVDNLNKATLYNGQSMAYTAKDMAQRKINELKRNGDTNDYDTITVTYTVK